MLDSIGFSGLRIPGFLVELKPQGRGPDGCRQSLEECIPRDIDAAEPLQVRGAELDIQQLEATAPKVRDQVDKAGLRSVTALLRMAEHRLPEEDATEGHPVEPRDKFLTPPGLDRVAEAHLVQFKKGSNDPLIDPGLVLGRPRSGTGMNHRFKVTICRHLVHVGANHPREAAGHMERFQGQDRPWIGTEPVHATALGIRHREHALHVPGQDEFRGKGGLIMFERSCHAEVCLQDRWSRLEPYGSLVSETAMSILIPLAFCWSACGDIVITEIMYDPASPEREGQPEWVEIANLSRNTVELEEWSLDDEDTKDWGPFTCTLKPGQVAVLINGDATDEDAFREAWTDDETSKADFLVLPISWASLANKPTAENEVLQLKDGEGTVIAEANYRQDDGWPKADRSGASIYLRVLDPEKQGEGEAWARSSVGVDGAHACANSDIFTGKDIGSPGLLPQATNQPVKPASTPPTKPGPPRETPPATPKPEPPAKPTTPKPDPPPEDEDDIPY